MIPASAPQKVYQGLGYYQSTGVGPVSVKLEAFINAEAIDTFQLAAISEATYQEAAKFIRLLPVIFSIPEIVPEPNGQIGFEWHVRPDHMFVVAVGGTQLLTFAGLFGGESSSHGTDPFTDSLPESVVTHLQRLFGD